MKAKNVIVTGGAGFIGSHVVDRLLYDNHRVAVIDNLSTGRKENLSHCLKGITFIEADVSDLKGILPHFKGKDMVFHLAALADIVPSIVDPVSYYKANVTGTMSVLEAARLSGVKKVIYAASSSCYGIPPEGHYPAKETVPIDPQYPYALTKYLGEETLLHWGKVYKMDVVSLRLFNVYGPRARTSGTYGAVLGVFLAQKLSGKPFTVVGDGTQRRDFVYVSDVANAFVSAAYSSLSHEIFNVGTGKPQSINTLVDLLQGEKVYIPKRPGEPDCTWADITRIQNILGWKPEVSFKEGVSRVLDHIDYWKDAPVWTPDSIQEATEDWFKFLVKKD